MDNVKNKSEVKPKKDYCGQIYELVEGDNIDIAVAEIAPGAKSTPHKHKKTEEIYYVTSGKGQMYVGNKITTVKPGTAVYVPLKTLHWIKNKGNEPLEVVVACSPPSDPNDHHLEPWKDK